MMLCVSFYNVVEREAGSVLPRRGKLKSEKINIMSRAKSTTPTISHLKAHFAMKILKKRRIRL